jgi:hypothetical protein
MTDTLTSALNEVVQVLETENHLLSLHDYKAVAALLDRKQTALGTLERARGTEPDASQGDLARRINVLVVENRRLLDRALTVQRHVLDVICNAARNALPVDRYGASGQRALPSTTAVAFRVRA